MCLKLASGLMQYIPQVSIYLISQSSNWYFLDSLSMFAAGTKLISDQYFIYPDGCLVRVPNNIGAPMNSASENVLPNFGISSKRGNPANGYCTPLSGSVPQRSASVPQVEITDRVMLGLWIERLGDFVRLPEPSLVGDCQGVNRHMESRDY